MNRTNALAAALQSAALSLWAFPALVLAQAQPPSGPAPAPGDTAARTGWAGWLWVIAAAVVIAIVWWVLTSRRRREAPR